VSRPPEDGWGSKPALEGRLLAAQEGTVAAGFLVCCKNVENTVI